MPVENQRLITICLQPVIDATNKAHNLDIRKTFTTPELHNR